MYEQDSLAAVNHICAIHEDMNGCKNLKGFIKGLLRKYKYIRINIVQPDPLITDH